MTETSRADHQPYIDESQSENGVSQALDTISERLDELSGPYILGSQPDIEAAVNVVVADTLINQNSTNAEETVNQVLKQFGQININDYYAHAINAVIAVALAREGGIWAATYMIDPAKNLVSHQHVPYIYLAVAERYAQHGQDANAAQYFMEKAFLATGGKGLDTNHLDFFNRAFSAAINAKSSTEQLKNMYDRP